MSIAQSDPEVVIAEMLKNVAGVNAVRCAVGQRQTGNDVAKTYHFGKDRWSALEEKPYQREALQSQRRRNIKIDPVRRGPKTAAMLNVSSHLIAPTTDELLNFGSDALITTLAHRKLIAAATSIALTEFPRQLLGECYSLDNGRWALTAARAGNRAVWLGIRQIGESLVADQNL